MKQSKTYTKSIIQTNRNDGGLETFMLKLFKTVLNIFKIKFMFMIEMQFSVEFIK